MKEVGVSNTYGYDGDGMRVRQSSGGAAMFYVRSSVLKNVAMEVTATGGAVRAYVQAGNKTVAMSSRDGQFYWLHTNHLNSSRAMTDINGTLVYKGQYDPYGKALLEWSATNDSGLNSRKFTGYERDATGLDYANARTYASERGRFLQPDPTGLKGANRNTPGSLNLYSYVNNDPINSIDPSGNFLANPWCSQIYIDNIYVGNTCGGGWTDFFDLPYPEFSSPAESLPEPIWPQTCEDYMSALGLALQLETTDEGALSRLIFIETGWVASMEENGIAMAALAATVMNRHEFLNQKGLKQIETGGFGSVGASIQDIIYSRGKNPNGISNIATQYAGFTPAGIDPLHSNRVAAALQSDPATGDCQHLIGAIGYAQAALMLKSAIDPFGGKTWGVRTAGKGAPGWGGQEYKITELAGQVFYGWKGWR